MEELAVIPKPHLLQSIADVIPKGRRLPVRRVLESLLAKFRDAGRVLAEESRQDHIHLAAAVVGDGHMPHVEIPERGEQRHASCPIAGLQPPGEYHALL